KDICIGCGYCFYACPFGAPQYPRVGNFGSRGKMDKCTFCAGGPEPDGSAAEYEKYGANRLAEGKLPLCAEMCSTKSLLAGDGDGISRRGAAAEFGRSDKKRGQRRAAAAAIQDDPGQEPHPRHQILHARAAGRARLAPFS